MPNIDEFNELLKEILGSKWVTNNGSFRKRLIDAGVIESPRRGELVFAVPYLLEYLKSDDKR
jgi:hypothetical protein